MGILVNDSGTWKDSVPYVNHDGTWKSPKEVWVNDSGTWKKVFQEDTSE